MKFSEMDLKYQIVDKILHVYKDSKYETLVEYMNSLMTTFKPKERIEKEKEYNDYFSNVYSPLLEETTIILENIESNPELFTKEEDKILGLTIKDYLDNNPDKHTEEIGQLLKQLSDPLEALNNKSTNILSSNTIEIEVNNFTGNKPNPLLEVFNYTSEQEYQIGKLILNLLKHTNIEKNTIDNNLISLNSIVTFNNGGFKQSKKIITFVVNKRADLDSKSIDELYQVMMQKNYDYGIIISLTSDFAESAKDAINDINWQTGENILLIGPEDIVKLLEDNDYEINHKKLQKTITYDAIVIEKKGEK